MEPIPDLPALPAPPSWSIALGTAGQWLVFTAAILFVLCSLSGFLRSARRDRIQGFLFGSASVALFGVMAVLGALFANDRFEWEYIRAHSDKAMGVAYKLAAIWSGQQGSFLLWAVMSALFGWLALRNAGPLRAPYLSVLAFFLAAISGILVYETPFEQVRIHGQMVVPVDGQGLVPSLLNYWVIIHPPTIFAGFGSLIVLFAFAVAAMRMRDPGDWIPRVRPWALLSFSLLGLGLCMGGFWAYETLGWGGFWAWDPVENTSFVPWCLLAVFVHSIFVQQARKQWRWANLLLAGLPFLSFLYGTFLTRSGFLGDTSVHSFAEMDRAALWVMVGFGSVAIVGFLAQWFASRKHFASKPATEDGRWNRTAFHWFGNAMFVLLALAAGIGMSVPLIQSLLGQKPKVVEEWLYHAVVPFFFIPLMLLMGLTPFSSWRKTDPGKFGNRAYIVICLTVGLAGLTLMVVNRTEWAGFLELATPVSFPFGLQAPRPLWVLFLAGLCFFGLIASLWRAGELWKRSKLGIGGLLSHAGVAILMAGLILSRGLEQKKEFVVQEGSITNALGYIVAAKPHTTDDITNRDNKVEFTVTRHGAEQTMRPGLYYTMMGDELKPMTWPAIAHRPLHDLYLALHAMELNASEAIPIQPGETKAYDRYDLTYEKMTREGEPGKAGTKFGAIVRLRDRETGEEFSAHPQVALAQGGMDQIPALVGHDYFLTIQGMEASKKSFVLQLHFRRAVYWAELFVKPFTSLVWMGTGILTLGTLLAAYYRRSPLGPARGGAESVAEQAPEPEKDAIGAPA